MLEKLQNPAEVGFCNEFGLNSRILISNDECGFEARGIAGIEISVVVSAIHIGVGGEAQTELRAVAPGYPAGVIVAYFEETVLLFQPAVVLVLRI